MADNVLFSAEYDNSKFAAGVTDNINQLKAMATEQKKLQDACDQTEKKLGEVSTALEQTNDQLNALDKSTADYTKNSDALKQKTSDLTKQYTSLETELKNNKVMLDNVTQSNVKVAESFKQISDTVNKNPIQPKINNADLLKFIQTARTQLSGIFKNFDFTDLNTLKTQLKTSGADVQSFIKIIDEAKTKLSALDPNTQEFKDLSQVVENANQVITAFNEVTGQSDTSTKSLRTRIKELREELTRLEDAGQEETQHYKETQLAAARLTDQYQDMQQRIRILASDTKLLDFGLSAVNAAASGFQAYTGVMQLFGLSNDDAAEAQKKLLAIMALVQGAQQLQNLLLKENVIRTVGADIASKALASTQKILAVAFGTSTTAVKGLSVALLTTGVGALVIALGFLISKISDWTDTTEEATAAQEKLNQTLLLQKEYFNDDLEAIDLNTNIRNEKLKQRGLTEASIYESNIQGIRQKITRVNEELQRLDDQRANATTVEQTKLVSDRQLELIDQGEKLKQQAILASEQEQTRILQKGREDAKKIGDQRLQDIKAANDLLAQIKKDLNLFGKTDEEKELIQLQDQFDSDKKILVKAGADVTELTELFEKRKMEIIVRYGNLRVDEERKIINELQDLQFDAAAKRIENIQNEFERGRDQIISEAAKTKEELQRQLNEQINNTLTQKSSGLISPEDAKDAIDNLNSVFNFLFEQVDINANTKLKELAGKSFQAGLQSIEANTKLQTQGIDTGANQEITKLSKLYTSGKLSYSEYQRELTRISNEEIEKRLQAERIAIETEIDEITKRLQSTDILDAERQQLQAQLSDFKLQLSNLDKEIADGKAEQMHSEEDQQNVHLHNMLNAYGSFVDGILNFINTIDKAESEHLERQIEYQNRRVEFAKEIADKGNADYLEMEQKRLDELQRQQEEHASKQLAIDSALTASKAALAAVGAVADAVETGNPFAAIAAVVAVIGAIAAAINFVNSFKAPVQTFAEGTEYAQLNGNSPGTDTIPARISEGERIVPHDVNRDYYKSLSAIQNRRIPPEIINRFVDTLISPRVHDLDFGRLANATDNYFANNQVDNNNKLALIHEQLLLLNENVDNADNFNLTMDEHGFALSVNKTIKRMNILKRS